MLKKSLILFLVIASITTNAFAVTSPRNSANPTESPVELFDSVTSQDAPENNTVNLSALTDTELLELQSLLPTELARRGLSESVLITNESMYEVGSDLPAGAYLFTACSNNTVEIVVAKDMDSLSNLGGDGTYESMVAALARVTNYSLEPNESLRLLLSDRQVIIVEAGIMISRSSSKLFN